MLEVLMSIFSTLTAWCPRWKLVPPTERLIKWSNCGEATIHGPGRIWHWPLVTEIEACDIRWKSLLTHVQTITLTDGKAVSARTLTRWRPDDLLTCVCSEEDYSDTVAEMAQSVLVDVLSTCNSDMIKSAKALNVALTVEMADEMREIGIAVKKCKFTELCVSPAFRIINDG